MIKKVEQRFSLMKAIGWVYIALALTLVIGGLLLSVSLFRSDFYADYRRGAHLVAGFGALGMFLLLALGMFVQGSMANAVADIDKNTRVNTQAIEATREVSERAVRTGQNAIKNSEAMVHAQSALQAARGEALPTEALPAPAAVVPAALPAAAVASTVADTDVFGAMASSPAPVLSSAAPAISALAPPPPGYDETTVSGVIGIGGKLTTVSEALRSITPPSMPVVETQHAFSADALVEPTRLPPPAAEMDLDMHEVVGAPIDSTDAVVQNLFARAKGAVVRTRRPWAREEEQPNSPRARS